MALTDGKLIVTDGAPYVEGADPGVTTNRQDLKSSSIDVTDVVTASSAFGTDNRLVRTDGTGKGSQASGVTLDDSDNLESPTGDMTSRRLGLSGDTTQSITAVSDTIVITHSVVRISSDADYVLTSTPTLADPANDTLIFVYNTGLNTICLQDESVLPGSNILLDGASGVLLPGEMIILLFNAAEGAWLVAAKPNSGLANVGFLGKVNEAAGVVKGDFVYFSGATGNFPQVSLGDNTDFSKADVIGVCQNAAGNNQQVTVTRIGSVTEQDTSSFSEGDILYLTTLGKYSNVHPVGIDAVIRVGHAIRIHASQGTVEVNIDKLIAINNHNGVVRVSVVNQNAGTSASASYTLINDEGHRVSFSLTSLANVQGAEEASFFTEGFGHMNFLINGNKDFRWFTEVGDTHNPAALAQVMNLLADGTLKLLTKSLSVIDNQGIVDSNLNELLHFLKVASAVNFLRITNAATGNDALLEALGSDTDVGLNAVTKGIGTFKINGAPQSGTNSGDEAAASLTVSGIVELATVAETNTGTDATRGVTPAGLVNYSKRERFETVDIPAGAITPTDTDSATTATFETATNEHAFDNFAFQGVTANQQITFDYNMPDEWDLGPIKVKFYTSPASGASSGDDYTFELKAVAVSHDDVMDVAYGTGQHVDQEVTAGVDADLHISAASAAITVGGSPALEDLTQFKITRLQNDASDNMPEDAKLRKIVIQYKTLTTAAAEW